MVRAIKKIGHKFAAIYTRKSRKDKNKLSHRYELQLEILPKIAQDRNWEYELYDDGHASASRQKLGELKERARLIHDVEAGKIHTVIIIEPTRLSRDDSGVDFFDLIETFKDNNVQIVTPDNVLKPWNPTEWFQLAINVLNSAYEMKTLHKRMKEGRDFARKSGKWVDAKPPAPYHYSKDTKTMIVDPKKLEPLKQIWALAETHSAAAIAAKLGLSQSSVRRAISDERLLFYQARRIDPQTEDSIVCNWESVMTAEQANRIRAARQTRKTNNVRREFSSLLTGLDLIKCGYCARSVKTWKNGRVRLDGTRLNYYGCQSKNVRAVCKESRMIAQSILDEKVLTNVFNTLSSLDDLMRFWNHSQQNQYIRAEVEKVEKERRSLDGKKGRLISLVSEGLATTDEIRGEMTRIKSLLSELEQRQAELASTESHEPDWDALNLSREEFNLLDAIDQRRFLKAVLERIDLFRNSALLTYPFPRNCKGSVQSRLHLPPSQRGTSKGRRPRIQTTDHSSKPGK